MKRQAREPDSYPAIPFSKARLDGGSVHEARPGGGLRSVTYEPDGSTTIAYEDGIAINATGYGRRVALRGVTA